MELGMLDTPKQLGVRLECFWVLKWPQQHMRLMVWDLCLCAGRFAASNHGIQTQVSSHIYTTAGADLTCLIMQSGTVARVSCSGHAPPEPGSPNLKYFEARMSYVQCFWARVWYGSVVFGWILDRVVERV